MMILLSIVKVPYFGFTAYSVEMQVAIVTYTESIHLLESLAFNKRSPQEGISQFVVNIDSHLQLAIQFQIYNDLAKTGYFYYAQ
jgi:hypothetical protein